MKCDNCKTDIAVIMTSTKLQFIHECTECGWCHLVWRMVNGPVGDYKVDKVIIRD